ncbi:ribosomal-protein-alanine N-acetyltransferase [candidate division KSB1 bacterium]|nr:ribosomal protein S18-alanine N-acetyltransferase [candidate division KSB1 bacterium]RQW01161.1 MAG: ribosomal-protein-alanine N-acetyltransferase [candidate division KSB1 bacterium]
MVPSTSECASYVAQKTFDNKPLVLRHMRLSDLKAVAQLEQEIFLSPWSMSSFHKELDNKISTTFVLLWHDLITGYTTFWIAADEVQILKIAVAPDFRQLGVAAWMLNTILQESRRLQAKIAFVEVRASNKNAIGFYKKNGFAVEGTRRDYYASPREDALLMQREL